MRLLHINTSAGRWWAARVATDLNNGLNKIWLSSHLVVNINKTTFANISEFHSCKSIICRWIRFVINKINTFLWLQDVFYLRYYKLKKMKMYQEADIIHLHNIHGYYFSLLILNKIYKDWKKIVWTLHDDRSFTGKCWFALDCNKWMIGCWHCPYKKLYPKLFLDTTKFFWKLKQKIYSNIKFNLVTPSLWLKKRVERSPLMKDKKVDLIYNGINTDVFYSRDKLECRKKYWIPDDKFVVMFIADGGKWNTWKWGQFLEQMMSDFSDIDNLYFLSVWNRDENDLKNGKELWYITDQDVLAEIYSLADVFVYPSLADNCPLVILEALACELPIVSFATAWIPELINHKKTWYIAKYRDFQDLKNWIIFFLSMWKSLATYWKDLGLEPMLTEYIKLYNSLL